MRVQRAYSCHQHCFQERNPTVNRNTLYLLIGLLVLGLIVLGYLYYQESRSGIDISIGEQGISIEGY
jgi:hypothetical protein